MLARITFLMSFLCGLNVLAANARPIDPFSKESQRTLKRAERIIKAVANKKDRESLSDEEQKFIDDYKIDLSKTIRSIYFAVLVKDKSSGDILGHNVVGISYFEGPVDRKSLKDDRNQSLFFSDDRNNYEAYSGIEFKVKELTPPAIMPPVVAPQPLMQKLPAFSFKQGPGNIFKNGKLIRLGAHEVVIDDQVYTCEEASKILGYPIKPVQTSGLDISFQ